MSGEQNWQLIKRYRCPQCDKRYAVAEWKQNPKCRQCGAKLRADEPEQKPLPVQPRTAN